MARIGCRLCAYAFDEALVVRERAHAGARARQEAKAQQSEAVLDDHRERIEQMKRELGR